ncbi:MAG: acyl-[acyl-carrier-protein]--UDP-N-acetylglucosamine O-acyltransferase [Proteobacteria bacterium]|nr:MAG: acyl-[acyl-carrier-protein]--UDP-N-acetylglucosamine O-acyltransferase [Pseudomonadota bacterium]
MIHPTAVIDPKAQLADTVSVGAFSVIGADVTIGAGCKIGPHVVIEGPCTIGEDNDIFQFASVGAAPQDKKHAGEPTELIIGDRNLIRENVTINRGTIQDIGKTVIGDDNWIMAYVHIAHDCVVGSNTIFANNATLAGHVHVYDYAILGGFTLVHQFCHVGEYSFTGMGTALSKDLPPYVMAHGAPALPRGINGEGLKRNGFDAESVARIKQCYRWLYRQDLLFRQALEKIEASYPEHEEIMLLSQFCKRSERGIIR